MKANPSLDRLRALAARVSFGPAFPLAAPRLCVELVDGGAGVALVLRYLPPDRATGATVPTSTLRVLAASVGERAFFGVVRDLCAEAAQHEIDESLRVDGALWADPHAAHAAPTAQLEGTP